MLGKGLESLIPPSRQQGGSASDNVSPPAHQGIPAPHEEDVLLAAGHVPEEIAAAAPSPSLPARPEPFLLELEPVEEAHPGEHREMIVPDAAPHDAPPLFPAVPAYEEREREEAPPISRIQAPKKPHAPAIARSREHASGDAIFYIETDKIKPNPHQPRRDFGNDAIEDLAASIREFGILQPLIVTKKVTDVPTGTEVEYELIAGERRLKAAKFLGLERIPAIVRTVDIERERLELAIIENLQREDLNPVEMARAFARLQDEFRLTQREIAVRLGKSRETIANTLRLLDLPTDIQDALARKEITESHGRLLLAIDDPAAQIALFRDLTGKRMTTRELRERIQEIAPSEDRKRGKDGEGAPEVKMLQERLASELGTPVKIQSHGASGRITISFYSQEELAHLVDRLAGRED